MEMSYFNAPITPIKDAEGRIIQKATVVPQMTVTLEQVFNLISENADIERMTQAVRAASDLRAAKATMLPYITPCGVFSYRKASALVKQSGLVPLDIDHLSSLEEAELLRDELFNDPYLLPMLTFVSPSGRGVKAFILKNEDFSLRYAMDYVRMMYGNCDTSGKDVARSCFLCHDAAAKCRLRL